MKSNLLLVDIGNTHFHIYDTVKVKHLSHEDAIVQYKQKELCYVSVKHQLSSQITEIKAWENISELIRIEGDYETMGVDRKALCLSRVDGIFVDAGSAITVDLVQKGIYIGGFILPGLKAYIESYKSISPALEIMLNKAVNLDDLPSTTKDGISYGIIASIKALIDKHSDGIQLYFTGGDGEFLSTFFEDAIYDETLVFQGIKKAIEKSKTLSKKE